MLVPISFIYSANGTSQTCRLDSTITSKGFLFKEFLINFLEAACQSDTNHVISFRHSIVHNHVMADNGISLQRSTKITYLGYQVNYNMAREIKARTEKASSAFFKIKKVLCGKNINFGLRITRPVKCYIFRILLYGVKSWM